MRPAPPPRRRSERNEQIPAWVFCSISRVDILRQPFQPGAARSGPGGVDRPHDGPRGGPPALSMPVHVAWTDAGLQLGQDIALHDFAAIPHDADQNSVGLGADRRAADMADDESSESARSEIDRGLP